MLQDSLRESWLYQRVLEEGRKEGRAEARAEGFAEGRIEGQEAVRKLLTLFTEKRFPATLARVQERLEQASDLQTLQEIEEALFSANTEEEVRLALLSTGKS